MKMFLVNISDQGRLKCPECRQNHQLPAYCFPICRLSERLREQFNLGQRKSDSNDQQTPSIAICRKCYNCEKLLGARCLRCWKFLCYRCESASFCGMMDGSLKKHKARELSLEEEEVDNALQVYLSTLQKEIQKKEVEIKTLRGKPNRKEADQLEKEIAEKMSDIERASLITCEQDKVKKILQIEAIPRIKTTLLLARMMRNCFIDDD